MGKSKKTRPAYVPPPPVVRTPEEEHRFSIELAVSVHMMEIRHAKRRIEQAMGSIQSNVTSIDQRPYESEAAAIAMKGAELAGNIATMRAYQAGLTMLKHVAESAGMDWAALTKEPS